MQLRPINDHIVVKALPAEATSLSGIIIPETVDKDRPERGEVLAVGPGRTTENGQRVPLEVKPGDKIIFKKYAPDQVKIDQVEYLIIKAEDVMAVIE
jgi:chaperonin GroES